jgi:hypothetical protein
MQFYDLPALQNPPTRVDLIVIMLRMTWAGRFRLSTADFRPLRDLNLRVASAPAFTKCNAAERGFQCYELK